MAEPKPFASLSSGLLARKGGAKPAMRPQSYAQMGVSLEDLGWNDMGHAPAPIAAVPDTPPFPADVPPPAVVEQQRVIERSFTPVKAKGRARRNGKKPAAAAAPIAAGRKAAFTLRLDAERHLKLRLACAVDHRSAQQIVTEALDTYLAALPELDTLVSKVPARGRRN